MTKQMFGTKGTMTEFYLGEDRHAVTKIHVPELTVAFIKTKERDGYQAIQVSFGPVKKHPNKAQLGHLKSKKAVSQFLKELPLPEEDFDIGDTITMSNVLKIGDILSVQGTTKGKGFAGTIKRWKFHGGPRTHGQSDRARAPGSIGQTTEIGRVFKGKKMAGRMGSDTQSSKNLSILYFNQELGELWVSGSVPGQVGGLLRLTVTGHNSKLDILAESQKDTTDTSNEPTPEKEPEKKVEAKEEKTKSKEKDQKAPSAPHSTKKATTKQEPQKTETKVDKKESEKKK